MPQKIGFVRPRDEPRDQQLSRQKACSNVPHTRRTHADVGSGCPHIRGAAAAALARDSINGWRAACPHRKLKRRQMGKRPFGL